MLYRCPACGGEGSGYVDDHHAQCRGENCGDICPIQRPIDCEGCQGWGKVPYHKMVSLVNTFQFDPIMKCEMIDKFIKEAESALDKTDNSCYT